MNDEARRWINLEGPPPLFIQEMFDAARDVEPLTPEERATLLAAAPILEKLSQS